ncbi:MAG TPA: transglycosylase domain-containing protein [Chloroflexota bacterium]|nr:transglycosylase domain-containing protein [Chloroflexota bacterium]
MDASSARTRATGRLVLHLPLRHRAARGNDQRGRRGAGIVFAVAFLAALVLGVWATTYATSSAVMLAERGVRQFPMGVPGGRPLDTDLPQTARITARDGSVVSYVNDVHFGWRQSVPLSRISPNMVLATLAAEDRRFFTHGGVDPVGIIRAAIQDASSEELRSGASTLDMQLARDIVLRDERNDQTLSRKLREAIAAIQLNERYSKAQIIEAYLNTVYYGNMAYGVEAAAERYFGKTAAQLTVPEAALLAGLPQSPTAYNPERDPDAALARRNHVLDLMAASSFIRQADADAMEAEPIELSDTYAALPPGSHWANYVQDILRDRFGPKLLYTAGLQVETTLDPRIQSMAQRVVTENGDVRRVAHANNTAVVVLDARTSQILAMVGSKDFNDASIDGQVNVAISKRQPGSSIKPLVYLTGFEKGLYPAVQVVDAPTVFSAPPGQPPYVPKNYENHYYGRVTLRDALGNSLNVPAVKVLKYVGIPAFQDMARRFGITTLDNWDPRWLSLTLGGGEVKLLELTNAYAAIAREGAYLPAEPFLKITDANGAVLYEASDHPVGDQVVDPRLAYQLLSVMGDTSAREVTYAPNSPINLPRPHMVKTGTTDDYRDTWTIGCIPQICVGVWMGNTDNRPMVKPSSSLTAGKVWSDLMRALIEDNDWAPEPFPVPDGVTVVTESDRSGARPRVVPHEEVFLPGQQGHRETLEMDWRRPDQ